MRPQIRLVARNPDEVVRTDIFVRTTHLSCASDIGKDGRNHQPLL